ncbi:MAG: class A beta-lactamase-related serine hydrolase [Sphingobacteriales bacterium]|nr:MAG: class A beta-lactamase-related serine hydrolase [Sphingobacteriales bacterium]
MLLLIISHSSFSQAQKAEEEIRSLMNRRNVAGLSVAVVKNGKMIYTNAFGMKDVEKSIPLATTDVFRIASISKSFSATAIMQMVEKGRISLDDDFGKLVGFPVRNPKFPEAVITLRMVLSHTSSINDSQGYFNLDVIDPSKGTNWAKCFNDYEPGKGYQYCNLNFNMVGVVLEKLSGQRFDRYIKQQILDPLGLYGGYYVDSLDKTRFAILYEFNGTTKKLTASPAAYNPRTEEIKNYVMGYTTPIFSPTGGMKISAPDLAKYMTMHMNFGKYKGGRIISKKSAQTMQTSLSDVENYGLALWRTTKLVDGKELVGHTGSAYGLYSAMFFDPKDKFGIVIITNGCDPVSKDGYVEVIKESYNILYNNLIK